MPGRLDRLVTLRRYLGLGPPDSHGQRPELFADPVTVWAERRDISGDEGIYASADVVITRTAWTVRATVATVGINARSRLEVDGVILDVESVLETPPTTRRRFLTLITRRVD